MDQKDRAVQRFLLDIGTHFVSWGKGIKVFQTGKCEYCKGEVQESDATMIKVSPNYAKELGLIQLDKEPSEIFWSDEHGCCTCEKCDG